MFTVHRSWSRDGLRAGTQRVEYVATKGNRAKGDKEVEGVKIEDESIV